MKGKKVYPLLQRTTTVSLGALQYVQYAEFQYIYHTK